MTYPTIEPNRLPSTGPFAIPFYVKNIGTSTILALTTSCLFSGPITCSSVQPTDIASIAPGDSVLITVTYSTTASTGSGTIGTRAQPDVGQGAQQTRSVLVAPAGKARPTFANHSDDNIDRGLCLTVGAGEAAGLSCGDLFVVQSMPVYRTLGRDRSLGLLYNSATATGLYLLAANVNEPGTNATPDKVKLVLTVGTSTDSAEFGTQKYPYSDTLRQMVLGRGLAPQATGIYPISLLVRNVYSTSVQDTTITATALIVNRASSEYGRGWALLGVEQVLFPADTSQRVWVAGDGSIRLYRQKTPGSNIFVGATGDAPDSLVRFDTLSARWYRRDLKHGAAVYFDQTGRHQATRNRVGAITTFTWGSIAGQTRLLSIAVPPNGGGFTYHLYWNATTAKLDSIQDPYARTLKATMTFGSDTTLTRLVQKTAFPQDDWDTTSFEYSGGRITRRLAESSALAGGFAGTVYQYQNSARVTKVKIPSGLTGSDTAFITITPWDEKGLALAYSNQVGVLTIADTGLATRVDGPIAGTGDAADFWVNRFGQPIKSVQLGLSATTLLWHDSTVSLPAAVTKVKYPNGRVVRLSYNTRGNLTQQVDSTSHLGVLGFPNNVTTWAYGDAGTPDSPTQITDALGRHSDYAYNSLGLTDSVVDSRGTRTKFFSRLGATDPLRGEVDSVVDRQVETWLEASGPDTAQEVIRDQTNGFTYDARGNVVTWTSPVGVTTAYARNLAGFVTDAYDPMGYHRAWGMDGFNRVTGYTQRVAKENAPGVNQLLNCDVKQVACTAAAAPYNVASQFQTDLSSTFHYNDDGIDIADDPRLVERRFAYDAAGHQAKEWDGYDTQSSGTTRRITYFNPAGLLDSTVSRTGLKVRYRYDAIGRRSAMVLPTVKTPYQGAGYSISDTVYGDSVSYTYDIMSNVLVSTNRWGAITRSYYANGLVRSQVSMQDVKDSMYFRYDATGTRTRLIHVRGTTTDSIGYFYGTATGDLDSMLVWWGSPLNAVRKLVFVWDRLGRRRQVTYPSLSGLVVSYKYDGAGILRRIVANNPPLLRGANRFTFQWDNDAVDPSGRILHQFASCAWPFGSTEDPTGMACGGHPTLETTNAFDRFGVLVYQQTSGVTIETDSMGYDRSGNLIHQRKNGSPTDFAMDTRVGIAPNNLLSSRLDTTGLAMTYAYTGELARSHEQTQPNGAEVGTYWYDALGRTSGIGKASGQTRLGPNSCLYDGDGQLREPCDNFAPLLGYDGHHVAGGGNGGNSWVFVYGPSVDDPLIGLNRGINSTTTEFYWITDGRGRQFAVGLPDGSLNSGAISTYQGGGQYAGGTQNAHTFNADRFGSVNIPSVSVFRNRVYDQQTGRWTQEDPIGIAGGLNLYQYAGNNPAVYTDPFGLCPPIDDCLRKANLIGTILILGNGLRPLSLGSRPEGVTQNVAGTNVTTTQTTNFGLGLNPLTGNAAVGFTGGLQIDVNNRPDPILEKGGLDLGTGQYEAIGHLNNIPTSSVHVTGNLKTGKGNVESCVLVVICFNTPLNTKEEKKEPQQQETPQSPKD